jgi:hypothetical protein
MIFFSNWDEWPSFLPIRPYQKSWTFGKDWVHANISKKSDIQVGKIGGLKTRWQSRNPEKRPFLRVQNSQTLKLVVCTPIQRLKFFYNKKRDKKTIRWDNETRQCNTIVRQATNEMSQSNETMWHYKKLRCKKTRQSNEMRGHNETQ